MARPETFELPAIWLEAGCSIHLNYGGVDKINDLRLF
mgnify:FL=1